MELTKYEKERQAKIERNKLFLDQLGLAKANKTFTKPKPITKRKKKQQVVVTTRRKSARLQSKPMPCFTEEKIYVRRKRTRTRTTKKKKIQPKLEFALAVNFAALGLPDLTDLLTNNETEVEEPVFGAKDVIYYIDKILARRTTKNGKVQYLVKWVGFAKKDNLWVDEEKVKPYPEKIRIFEMRVKGIKVPQTTNRFKKDCGVVLYTRVV
mmetsp:Transcript_4613/g.5009  ORF Transcript_4613/g.5009 Transcript_4613/m.5009 type:complete len:210 (+) Transcript_4613:129-758(+)